MAAGSDRCWNGGGGRRVLVGVDLRAGLRPDHTAESCPRREEGSKSAAALPRENGARSVIATGVGRCRPLN